MLNGLDLFSGIGGLALALAPWVRPVAYCEIDPYAQGVLLSRMSDGSLPVAPIWDDIGTFRVSDLDVEIDIIYGGFPCQDISCAGTRKGLTGERSGLFFEIVRLAKELEPALVFLENSDEAAKYRDTIFASFEAIGYACRDGVITAAEACDADHERNRYWFLAYLDRAELWQQSRRGNGTSRQKTPVASSDGCARAFADSQGERMQEWSICAPEERGQEGVVSHGDVEWDIEPCLVRGVHGVSYRSHRIKCLGNAVVPQCARVAFERLAGIGGVA